MPLPNFLIKKIPKKENILRIRGLIGNNNIHTVCEEAKCPNIGECYSRKTCTFMILGNICTRHCAFCGVSYGRPLPPDPDEPEKIALAARRLELKYVVVTSVTRDDLPDGGAGQFAAVVRSLFPLPVELLIPDFGGSNPALETVLEAKPLVLNHNIETVPRLYGKIRPQANYERSLKILKFAKEYRPPKLDLSPKARRAKGEERRRIYTKSGFMVGLGESDEEVISVLGDLRAASCDSVTIGQYLPPSRSHPGAERFVPPEVFERWKAVGHEMGFYRIEAGPFVRSSYQAEEAINV